MKWLGFTPGCRGGWIRAVLHALLVAPGGFAVASPPVPSPQRATETRTVAAADARENPLKWAFGRVWYQVFPERFANAQPANDPAGASVVRKAWTSPWDVVDAAEAEAAMLRRLGVGTGRSADGDAGSMPSVVFHRRYGGDLQGVVERLGWLRDLGVDGLYLCPIFQSPSLHKYDASDYAHIDPTLGHPGVPTAEDLAVCAPADPFDERGWGWTASDRYFVETLLPSARGAGLRVVLDGVWNHVGTDHWAFADVWARGRASPYAEWFESRFDDEGRLVGWGAWDRVNGGLPRWARTADGQNLVEPVKRHIFAVTRRWMDPNGDGDPSDGIDGWRLDVAAEIPRGFWREWRDLVKSINPGAVIVGEVWFDARAYFDGTAFDSQMNYPFAEAVTAWLGRDAAFDSGRLAAALTRVFSHEPATDLTQFNLLTSHDTERLVSMLMNPGRAYDPGVAWDHVASGRYVDGPADEATLRRALIGWALVACAPGAPMLYQGEEFGMNGADDPHNRRPMPWPDVMSEEAWRGVGVGASGATAAEVGRWMGLRHHPVAGPVLRRGTTRVSSTAGGVLVIDRRLGTDRVVFAARLGGAGSAGVDAAAGGALLAGVGLVDAGGLGAESAGAWLVRE